METHGYPIKNIENPSSKLEQESEIPIIDVIRHDSTPRKQNESGFHNAPPLPVDDPDFKLDADHLDLNEEGIVSMKTSANQLADLIDKEKETVLIVSSPAWRTHSSALVLKEVLIKRGVSILNKDKTPKFFKAINQHSSFFLKIIKRDFGDNDETRQVIDDYIKKGYKEGYKSASKILGIREEEVEKRMDEAETLSFQKFLRHMNNIYNWLDPETLKSLKGRKLRIVVLAHWETTRGFIEAFMPKDTLPQEYGQILEITQRSNIKLHPKKGQNSKVGSQMERKF